MTILPMGLALLQAAAPISAATESPIHYVGDVAAMQVWLGRTPITRDFPPDLEATLSSQRRMFVIEMSSMPGCVPCGDLWSKLSKLGQGHRWQVGAIGERAAMERSGRLGLPWVGHPTAWVRSIQDEARMIPIAIGADHSSNLRRNIYLAVKMLGGVRPAVGVRAMARFTGIMGLPPKGGRRPGDMNKKVPVAVPKAPSFPISKAWPAWRTRLRICSIPPGDRHARPRPLHSCPAAFQPDPIGSPWLRPSWLHGEPCAGARLGGELVRQCDL